MKPARGSPRRCPRPRSRSAISSGRESSSANGMRWRTASRERLARMPEDSIAREMLVHRAEARGEFTAIPAIIQPLIDSGRANTSDYNQYAWTALLAMPVPEQAVEAARMAYDETQGRNFSVAHTLACVYAATGKPREARDLLLKGLEQAGSRSARRFGVVWLRPRGRGVWRRRFRARLLPRTCRSRRKARCGRAACMRCRSRGSTR